MGGPGGIAGSDIGRIGGWGLKMERREGRVPESGNLQAEQRPCR
jgi:hypothetical protein